MKLEQLVRDYAPVLHFHPEEGVHCCYPSDAEKIFERFHNDWSQFKEDKTPKTLDETAPCYFETWTDTSLTQIRYWFWYNYNDFPSGRVRVGKHLGDWEHIEVRLFDEKKTVWLLSNHLSARVAMREGAFAEFSVERPLLSGDHINAWVALGSHAHYPSPSSKPRCYAHVFCDKIAEGGLVWTTANALKPLRETNFKGFEGRWGDEKAPRSPFNPYNNRWRSAPDIQPV
jgi:hypothetical protein